MKNKLIYGAVIGDAYGSNYEFASYPDEKSQDLNHPEFLDNRYTDDTLMTFAIAKALEEKGDIADTMRRVGRIYSCPKGGYGRRFEQWLLSATEEPINSYGNGAGMRISSVAYFAKTEEECKKLAYEATAVTHNHPEGIKGATVVALLVFYALHGMSKEKMKEYASSQYNIDLDLEDLHQHYRHDETCQNSIPQALYCFFSSDSFMDCLNRVCYIGGDADTIGAMSLGIASAYYKDVPQKMYRQVRDLMYQDMIDVFDAVPLNTEKLY